MKLNRPYYYKTCSECGANLDPGEKCDCWLEKAKSVEPPIEDSILNKVLDEQYIINVDSSAGKDHTVIIVYQNQGDDEYRMIGSYIDEDADHFYKIITAQNFPNQPKLF